MTLSPGGWRPVWHSPQKLKLKLNVADWPTDVPLPEPSTPHRNGATEFSPQIIYSWQNGHLLEEVWGHFDTPCTLPDLVAWYAQQMQAWQGATSPTHSLTRAELCYTHPTQPQVTTRITIRTYPHTSQTGLMICRRVVHP